MKCKCSYKCCIDRFYWFYLFFRWLKWSVCCDLWFVICWSCSKKRKDRLCVSSSSWKNVSAKTPTQSGWIYTQNPYQTDTIVRGKLFHFVESLKVVHEIVLLNACAILWRVYEVAWMQRRKSTRLRTGSSFESCQNGFEFPNFKLCAVSSSILVALGSNWGYKRFQNKSIF